MMHADVQSLLAKEIMCHERLKGTMMKKASLKIVIIVCVQDMQVSHVTNVRKTVKKNEMIRTHYRL